MRLLPDFQPAREHPAFRRLLVGNLLSALGGSMTAFAVTLQVWDQTRSSFAVGALGFRFVPVLILGLLGGSIADTVDRRRLVLVATVALSGVSALFAVQAYAGFGKLWILYLLAVVQAMLQAISAPAGRTFVPQLLPSEQLRAGIALHTLTGRVAMLAGPALAGLVAGVWGLRTCYAIDVVSFAAALYATARLPAMRPAPSATHSEPSSQRSLPAIIDGLRFIRRNPVIAAAFLTDLDAMLLGLPVALFPALNAEHFGGRPQTLGLLSAAVGVGGLLSAVLSGPASRFAWQGRGMLAGTMIWGAGIAAFSLVRSLPLALSLLALAGAADTLTVTFRTSIVQSLTPDEFRGRVSSVEYIIGTGGGPLGNVEAGTVASLTSPAISAFSGGIGCLAAAVLIALAFPALTRHSSARLPAAPGRRGQIRPHHRRLHRGGALVRRRSACRSQNASLSWTAFPQVMMQIGVHRLK
jgi:MFS family permease